MDIKFVKIKPTKAQIQDLYYLLEKREFGISHKLVPSYKEHEEFVNKNPYKYWYIILLNENITGSFYIMSNNSVGINLLSANKKILKKIIDFINENFTPEMGVKSYIPDHFYINISDKNLPMKKLFKSLGS